MTLLLILNAYHDVVNFRLPEVVGGAWWTCLCDTNQPILDEPTRHDFGSEYEVTGRSLLLRSTKRAAPQIAIEKTRVIPTPAMTEATRASLGRSGVARRQIFTERFAL